jgi:hypothetical protein
VILQNSGASSTTITGACSLTFGGATYLGTATPVGTLVSGGSTTVKCTSNAAGSHAVAGSQITGSIVVGSGADVLFSTAAQ